MTRMRSFVRFWYAFVVGDDWRIAAGTAVALAGVAGLAHHGVNAWWLPPIVVTLLFGSSLRRAVLARRRR